MSHTKITFSINNSIKLQHSKSIASGKTINTNGKRQTLETD